MLTFAEQFGEGRQRLDKMQTGVCFCIGFALPLCPKLNNHFHKRNDRFPSHERYSCYK